MKNLFSKPNNTTVAVSIAIGSVAAGAAGYLFLTKSGSSLRHRISGWFSKKN